MPGLLDEGSPEVPGCRAPEPWTPMQQPQPAAGTAREPVGARSEWRGTAAQAVEESARRFEGTPTGFVSGDWAGDRSARAVPAESLIASMRSVTDRFGDAGPVYTVREDGSIYNTVTNRTEYVPVCLGPRHASATPAAGSPAPTPTAGVAAAPGLAGAKASVEVAPKPPESHWYTRPLGALKMVGGALETVAGGALFAGGVASSEAGVGVPVAIVGGAVTLHGIDTTASGARTLWYGQDLDTLTSQGLQAAGMRRSTANLVDAGVGVVGSLGAGAGARALAATGEAGSISVAFKAGLPTGHNLVGVTTEAGTQWSHLAVRGARTVDSLEPAGSTILKEGEAVISAARAPPAAYSVMTVPVSAARAEAALETMSASRGPAGAYSYLGNNCATHAADVMRAGGVATPWFTTPIVNLASAALRSPGFVGAVSTSSAAVEGTTGVATFATGAATKDEEVGTGAGGR